MVSKANHVLTRLLIDSLIAEFFKNLNSDSTKFYNLAVVDR